LVFARIKILPEKKFRIFVKLFTALAEPRKTYIFFLAKKTPEYSGVFFSGVSQI
jgi:hypothetical protein